MSSPYLTGAIVRIAADVMATAAGTAHAAARCHHGDHEKDEETKGHFVRMDAVIFLLKMSTCVNYDIPLHHCTCTILPAS